MFRKKIQFAHLSFGFGEGEWWEGLIFLHCVFFLTISKFSHLSFGFDACGWVVGGFDFSPRCFCLQFLNFLTFHLVLAQVGGFDFS